MADSLGTLVDKLSILNIKIWHVQDDFFRWAQISPQDFEQKSHADIQAAIKKLTSLNLERNQVMTVIDQCLAEAVASGKAEVENRVKLTGSAL